MVGVMIDSNVGGGSTAAYAWIKLTGGTPGQPKTAKLNGRIVSAGEFSSQGILYLPVSRTGSYKVDGYTGSSSSYNVIASNKVYDKTTLDSGKTFDAFSNTTNADLVSISSMLYNGEITSNDIGWKVGDTKNIKVNGSDYEWVILDTGANANYTFDNGKTVGYLLGMKNCYSESRQMNTSNTNSGSWMESNMRTWCNSDFKNLVDSSIVDAFKPFNVVTATEYNSTGITKVQDTFALAAYSEIFSDNAAFPTQAEHDALKQFEWYKNESNRKKTRNGSVTYWWTRSPYRRYSNHFCGVTSGGSADYNYVDYSYGVSPFGCI